MASDYDEYEYDEYDEYDEEYDSEMDLETGEAAPAREFFGLSIPEITILGVLVTIICIFGAFTGIDLIRNIKTSMATATPTAIPPTLTPSVTPLVKLTPIPTWSRFEFADAQAEIWLPSSYQGGDPVAYPEIVAMTIDVFVSDEAFATYAKGVISDTATVLFAFDTEPIEFGRSVSVYRESLAGNPEISINEYLTQSINSITDRDVWVKNQYISDLYYYSDVGVLIFEEKIMLSEKESIFIRYYQFAIRNDDEVWSLIYQIDRDDASNYQDTIFNSARSFYLQP